MLSSPFRHAQRATLAVSVVMLAACSADQPIAPDQVDPNPPTIGTTSSRIRTEGYRTRGEIRSGWVLSRTGLPMQVTFEVHNGLAIWQGDIELGKASEISSTPQGARPYMRIASGASYLNAQPGLVIDGDGFRWPGGVVPYTAEADLPGKDRITKAIEMIETQTGGITFVPRTDQADYVKFIYDGSACSSAVGRQGGEQTIKLAFDCSTGSTAHELLHALGLDHEQSRCDRDTYVEIQFDNVEDGKAHNFDKACDGHTDTGPYDFGSIMHYSLLAFSKNDQPTIKLRPGITYDGTIGQRSQLGTQDRLALNGLYGLNNKLPVAAICGMTASYLEGSELQFDGTCSTDADDKVLYYDWNMGDGTCAGDSGPVCTEAKPKHTYANDGTYKVGLTVSDGYQLDPTEIFLSVGNVAPTFNLFGFGAITEGSGISRSNGFTDPGADFWSGTATFGDGSPAQALGILVTPTSKSFSFAHSYPDNNPPGSPFQLSISLRDDDVTTTHTTNVSVLNALPRVVAGDDVTVESGQSFNLSGSFTDLGVLDAPWQWSINWGSGSPTTGSMTSQGNINATRQMCVAGTHTVVLSVTDKDGGTGTDNVQVTVGFVVVSLDITPGGTPNPVNMKNKGALPVAILSSATFDARTIDVASLRLGDESGTDTPAVKQKNQYVTRLEDVNRDGRLDMIASFSVPALVANGDLAESTTTLVLRGAQGAGGGSCVNFRGSDAVVAIP